MSTHRGRYSVPPPQTPKPPVWWTILQLCWLLGAGAILVGLLLAGLGDLIRWAFRIR